MRSTMSREKQYDGPILVQQCLYAEKHAVILSFVNLCG